MLKLKIGFYQIYSLVLIVILFTLTYSDSLYLFYFFVALLIPLVNKPIYILPSYIISSLSGSLFSIDAGTSLSRYISLILLFALLFHLIQNKQLNNKGYLSFLILMLLIIFNFFSAAFSYTTSFNAFFLMLQNLLIFYFLPKINCDINELYKLIYYSAIITLIGILVKFSTSDINIFLVKNRLSINENVNENRFAMMTAQLGAITISSIFILFKEKKIKLLGLFGFLLACFLIILSGSRSALVGLVLSFILTTLLFSRNRLRRTVLIFLTGSIIVSFMWIFIEDLNLPFIDRFTFKEVIESQGSNRIPFLLIELKQIIPENFLFGVGLGGENIIAAGAKYNLIKPGHNMFIDTLTQVGLIGFTLYFTIIVKLIILLIKSAKNNIYLYLPLIMSLTAIFNGIGENMFLEKLFWNSLAIGALIMNNFPSKIKQLGSY